MQVATRMGALSVHAERQRFSFPLYRDIYQRKLAVLPLPYGKPDWVIYAVQLRCECSQYLLFDHAEAIVYVT